MPWGQGEGVGRRGLAGSIWGLESRSRGLQVMGQGAVRLGDVGLEIPGGEVRWGLSR